MDIAEFIMAYLRWPEPCLTILPLDSNVPDCFILGSKPAKANILFGLEKFLISPYSDKMDAADIFPIPGIVSILGLSTLIIVEICLYLDISIPT